MACCDIFEVFDEKNNLIKEYQYWRLLVRNVNQTLGNCVAITKQHHEALSELRHEEMKEFLDVVQDLDAALQSAFSYQKINYLMLMMRDKHTHFHIIPRYSSPKNFAGTQWTDDGWPKLPGPHKPEVSQEILNQVKEEIKKHMKE